MRGRRARKKVRMVEGQAIGLGRGGDAVVQTSAGRVFVPDMLPGDAGEIAIEDKRAGALFGRLVRRTKGSEQRIDAACEHASRCGGCPCMALLDDAEHAWKLSLVEQATGVPSQEIHWVQGERLAYRRRARLAWRAAERLVGYRRRRSKHVTNIRACIVLEEPLQRVLEAFRERLLPKLEGQGELHLGRSDEGALAVVRTSSTQNPSFYGAAERLVKEGLAAGVVLDIDGLKAVFGSEEERSTHWDGQELVGPAGGFSQAHGLNHQLVESASDAVDGFSERAKVLELYAGHGNFTVALARKHEVVAVEQDTAAVECARENLRRRGLKAKFVAADATEPPTGAFDVLMLDPPRSGAKEALLAWCDELTKGPKRVVYVSCDTATLRRDLKLLKLRGFVVSHVRAFDLFPQTAHVESFVVLDRP